MAGTTGTPGNIPLFDDDSDFAPIQNPFNSISNALNAALTTFQAQTYLRYPTKAAMDAVPGTAAGQHASVYADSTVLNNGDYWWNGTSWVLGGFAGAIAPNTNYTLDGTVLERDLSGWVRLSIAAVRKSGTLVSTEAVGTLPTGFRPAVNVFRPVATTAAGGEAGQLYLGADGSMKIYLSTSKTGFYGDALYKAGS